MEKNFNLNEKINFLYNSCYDNMDIGYSQIDKLRENEFNRIQKGGGNNLNEDEYKITLKQDPYLRKDIIKQVSNGKFKILKNDVNSNELIIKRYSDNLPLNIYINEIKSSEKNPKDSNNDAKISHLLSPLVSNSKTKHIQLPILNLDLKYDDLMKIFGFNEKNTSDSNKEIITNISSNYGKNSRFNVSLKENFFKSNFLKDYLESNATHSEDETAKQSINKRLLFQVIHTLGVINEKYPTFSHNNLKFKNVMIYKKSKNESSNSKYKFKNLKFKIPNNNFDIKISNFNKSDIESNNSKTVYNDLENFVDSFLEYSLNNKKKWNLDNDTKKFLGNIKSRLSRLQSNQYKKDSNKSKGKNILNIKSLLEDDYFKEFLVSSKKSSGSKKQNKVSGLQSKTDSSLNVTLDSESKKMFGSLGELDDDQLEKMNNKNQTGGSYDSVDEISNKYEQQGGYDRNQVPFKRDKNSPFLSNSERDTIKRRADDNPPPQPKGPEVIAEAKVYDTPQKSQVVLPQVYPPGHVPVPNPYYPYPNFQHAYGWQPNQIPVQKYYNISMSSPLGNHSTINRIYEDMLPVDPFLFTMKTLKERRELLRFFRNQILQHGDGEEISISPGPKKTLLSYVRLLELNPYTNFKNPYHGLAMGFMLYNAAYPLKYEQDKNHLAIIKNPIGMNIRMYELSVGACRALRVEKNISPDDFEVLREIKYYEYVRERILKNKVSPNFIKIFLYTIDSTSRIDYHQINTLKYRTFTRDNLEKEMENVKLINESHDLNKSQVTAFPNTIMKWKNYAVDPDKKVDLSESKATSLVAVTEAPNNNLIKWGSPLYQSYGAVQTQVETGYHSNAVWRSIIFQLVYACAVLQEHDIHFENFTLENNFFIKDLFVDPSKKDHWKYEVGKYRFYIPNYGYLLTVDSSFVDLFSGTEETIKNLNAKNNRKFKINSKLFSKNSNHGAYSRKEMHINAFRNLIDPDEFNNGLKKMGGKPPDAEIINLLDRMYRWYNSSSPRNPRTETIREYLKEFFPEFLHNRIGTKLTRDEFSLLPNFPDNKFYEGELLAYQERYGEWKWAVFLNDQPNDKKLIRIGVNQNPIEVFSSDLYKYPSNEIIRQDVKDGVLLDPEHTLEVYNLDN